mmetsp:Transcript_3163/g.10604  ORF Transcript_3163/g.10604 Transcript_3163/m.10604 type:complete len:207 (+) Transcript_3163:226-846(+)
MATTADSPTARTKRPLCQRRLEAASGHGAPRAASTRGPQRRTRSSKRARTSTARASPNSCRATSALTTRFAIGTGCSARLSGGPESLGAWPSVGRPRYPCSERAARPSTQASSGATLPEVRCRARRRASPSRRSPRRRWRTRAGTEVGRLRRMHSSTAPSASAACAGRRSRRCCPAAPNRAAATGGCAVSSGIFHSLASRPRARRR